MANLHVAFVLASNGFSDRALGPVWFGFRDAFERKKQKNPAEQVAADARLAVALGRKSGKMNCAPREARSEGRAVFRLNAS